MGRQHHFDRLATWVRSPTGFPAQLAHRLRYPRRKRKVVSLEWDHVTSYEQLLASRRPSFLELYGPGRLPANGELLFPELVTQEIVENHYLVRPEATGVGLGCLPDVWVSGPSLIGRSWLLYRLAPFMPLYVDHYLSSGLPIGDRKVTRKQPILAPEVTALVTHWNSGVYGHWLLEGLPKLLLLREIAQSLPPLRIALPTSLGSWVCEWIARILPDATIDAYDDRTKYLQCRTLLVPTLLSDPEHHLFHPEFARLLSGLQPSISSSARGTRLYVSRVTPSSFRRLSNQAEIEEIAVNEGLEVVTPETLSIPEQMEMFAGAEVIVGEFGSAMHNALFSPPGTKVFCLNWINGLQSRIAQLRQQRVGYLLPSDGVPLPYVEGAPLKAYRVDPQQFRKYLRMLLSR